MQYQQSSKVTTAANRKVDASFPYGAPAVKAPVGALKDNSRKLTSQKLNPTKCANPFQTNIKACKTTFSQSYVSGSIPCRLQSSASRHSLQWDANAASGFSADLLVVCADGLSETQHPYTLLAPMMFHELLLRAEGCLQMLAPVIEPVSTNIRKAMMSKETFGPALQALAALLQHSGDLLAPQLNKIVPMLARCAKEKAHKDNIYAVLRLIEEQCGPDATKLIKSKIPTY